MNKDSKISIVDALFMGILTVSADVAETAATFAISLPLIGPALPIAAWIYGFSMSAIIIFWLIIKGVSIKWFLSGSGLELIPIISALPARSMALAATLIIDWGPEEIKTATNLATGKMPKK